MSRQKKTQKSQKQYNIHNSVRVHIYDSTRDHKKIRAI